MKREILCKECRSSLIGKLGHYPGEGHKFAPGWSKGNFICDHCTAPLPPDTECYALSIWTDDRPYLPWEHEYITQAKP